MLNDFTVTLLHVIVVETIIANIHSQNSGGITMTIQPRLQPGTLAYVLHEPPDANTVRAQPGTAAHSL